MRGGIGYIEEFATARLLRDAHLGSIWEGTGNIVAIDALSRAVGRHGADSALGADLHARLDDSAGVPQGWRDHLHVEVIDMQASNTLQTIELPPQSVHGTRLARVQPDLPQLIYRGGCLLSWIHESNDSCL